MTSFRTYRGYPLNNPLESLLGETTSDREGKSCKKRTWRTLGGLSVSLQNSVVKVKADLADLADFVKTK